MFSPFFVAFSLFFLLLTYNYTSLRQNYAGYAILDQETQSTSPVSWNSLSTVNPLLSPAAPPSQISLLSLLSPSFPEEER